MKTRSKNPVRMAGNPSCQIGYQGESVRRQQAVRVRRNARSVDGRVVIFGAIPLAHDWVEGFRVEVAVVDLMPLRTQALGDLLMQRRAIARRDGIRVKNEHSQHTLRPVSKERLALAWRTQFAKQDESLLSLVPDRERRAPQTLKDVSRPGLAS